jgi:cytochrome c551/c552
MRFIAIAAASLSLAAATGQIARADDLPDQFRKEKCTMCHAVDHKSIGPSYNDIAAKYKGVADAQAQLTKKIKEGGGGVWGAAKMTPHPNISQADLDTMVKWILTH